MHEKLAFALGQMTPRMWISVLADGRVRVHVHTLSVVVVVLLGGMELAGSIETGDASDIHVSAYLHM